MIQNLPHHVLNMVEEVLWNGPVRLLIEQAFIDDGTEVAR